MPPPCGAALGIAERVPTWPRVLPGRTSAAHAGNQGGGRSWRCCPRSPAQPHGGTPGSGDHAGEMARCARTPFPLGKSHRETSRECAHSGCHQRSPAFYQRREVLERPKPHLSPGEVGDPGSLVQLYPYSPGQGPRWLIYLPALLPGEVGGTMAPKLCWLGEGEGAPPNPWASKRRGLEHGLESPHLTSLWALPFTRWVTLGKCQPR